jgi:hypothetical protein
VESSSLKMLSIQRDGWWRMEFSKAKHFSLSSKADQLTIFLLWKHVYYIQNILTFLTHSSVTNENHNHVHKALFPLSLRNNLWHER